MKSKISVSEFRDDVLGYRHFTLTSDEATSPLRVETQFDQIAVVLSPRPYISLKGASGIAIIRHIDTIRKKTKGIICTYIFACLDYSHGNDPLRTELRMDCFP